jgi:hypothetical protein
LLPCAPRRFGEFEKFIYDFLVGSEAAASGAGGSLHGGEGLRLKLQTPLFVADALMEAARVRLEAQTAAAKRELSSLESVRQQLARFKVGRPSYSTTICFRCHRSCKRFWLCATYSVLCTKPAQDQCQHCCHVAL